jgi:hypothetical protein
MRSTVVPVVALAGLLAGAALAQTALAQSAAPPARSSAPRRECFWSRNISGFTAPDDHTVYVRVAVSDIYRLDLMGYCPNVEWAQTIGVKTTAGNDYICQGLDADLIVPNPGIGPQRCAVSAVHKLTPAEVAALPKKARP